MTTNSRGNAAVVLAGMVLVCASVLPSAATAQAPANAPAGSMMLAEPPVPLLGPNMLGVQRVDDAETGTDASGAYFIKPDYSHGGSANTQYEAALHEDGLTRWSRASYATGRAKQTVFAMQFRDATGAYAAWTMQKGTDSKITKPEASGGAIFAVPTVCGGVCPTVVLAQSVVFEFIGEGPAVRKIISALPKVSGNQGLPPLLPTFLPEKGMVSGSARYAIGPIGFAAETMSAGGDPGSGIDVKSLGWEKYAEAVMADYSDTRGKEKLLLLLYPTPQLAGEHLRAIEAADATKALHTRREGELVLVASGTFPADAATKLIENIHLHNEVTFDKPVPPSFNSEIHKTYSLLTSIAVLFGVMGLAAVLLGFFLGGGRALVRKMQGKTAATEAEFLSLHLDPQNRPASFEHDPKA